MLEAIIPLLAIYGLTWSLMQSELLSIPRNWVMRNSVFMFKLLSCPFCTGFHSGWIIYLISQEHWSLRFFILWGLAGAAISFILSALVDKLLADQM